jgi:Bax protein
MLSLIQEAGGKPENLSQGGRYWMSRLAHDYGLKEIDFAALKARVDIIPASLALAQAANESGWGTSRFVREGNALFGQWTWDSSQGIAPKDRQEGKGNYSVRSFPDLGGSVSAYMRNLNTHSAYKTLRKTRAAMRASGKAPSGHALAGGLLRYSQRGKAYVEEIRGMISYDDFQRFDSARLGDAVLG